ncbi:MAG: hypothetical protein U1A78_06590 [Polyangia bacterium]
MTLLLAISMLAGIQTGNASRYGYAGDIYDRVGSFACRRTLSARYGDRVWQQMRSQGLAHRTLPCGARLGVCNVRTGQCTVAYVVDRGPWGALDRKGEWHVRTGRLLPGEHYRGELDLLPGTYSAINVVGIERVAFWPLPLPDAQSMRRGIKLPPLRAMGPSSVAFDISPLHREQPFPPLRDAQPSQVTYTLAGPAVAPPVLTAAEPEAAPVALAAALVRTEPALPAALPGRAMLLPLRLYETPRSRHSARRPFPPLRT